MRTRAQHMNAWTLTENPIFFFYRSKILDFTFHQILPQFRSSTTSFVFLAERTVPMLVHRMRNVCIRIVCAPTHPIQYGIRFANIIISLFAFAEKQFFAIIVVSSVQSVRLRLQMRNVLLSFILREKCAEPKIKWNNISLWAHNAQWGRRISRVIAEQAHDMFTGSSESLARESNLSRLHFFVWFFVSEFIIYE